MREWISDQTQNGNINNICDQFYLPAFALRGWRLLTMPRIGQLKRRAPASPSHHEFIAMTQVRPHDPGKDAGSGRVRHIVELLLALAFALACSAA